MKIIITEHQYHQLKVRRRLDKLWEFIKMTYPYMYPCDYSDANYLFAVAHEIGDVVMDTDYMDDDTIPIAKDMVYKIFADRLMRHWDDNCSDED